MYLFEKISKFFNNKKKYIYKKKRKEKNTQNNDIYIHCIHPVPARVLLDDVLWCNFSKVRNLSNDTLFERQFDLRAILGA